VTLPPEPLQEQPDVVLLWERSLASWLLALGEHGGHDDLHGSGRLSVTSTGELSCIVLKPVLPKPFLFSTPMKRCLPGPFIAQGRVVTMRLGARPVAPRWLKPYTTSRALGAANDVLHGVSSIELSCLLTLLY
jgi:hypothetical protein